MLLFLLPLGALLTALRLLLIAGLIVCVLVVEFKHVVHHAALWSRDHGA